MGTDFIQPLLRLPIAKWASLNYGLFTFSNEFHCGYFYDHFNGQDLHAARIFQTSFYHMTFIRLYSLKYTWYHM